jgi:hypothetical protein
MISYWAIEPSIFRKERDSMSVPTYQTFTGDYVKFLMMGLAVSTTTWLALCLFVAFILVPDDVRDTVLHGSDRQ